MRRKQSERLHGFKAMSYELWVLARSYLHNVGKYQNDNSFHTHIIFRIQPTFIHHIHCINKIYYLQIIIGVQYCSLLVSNHRSTQLFESWLSIISNTQHAHNTMMLLPQSILFISLLLSLLLTAQSWGSDTPFRECKCRRGGIVYSAH